ncbi:MAG: gamma-glutamyl-gamma-aminobutyrate hydrolase family protein [Planctomycetota bacterium]
MSGPPSPTILLSSYYYPSPSSPKTSWFHTAAPMAYADSVRLAGGVPLVAPPLDDDEQVADVLARCDAVLLVGGPDMNPAAYGQQPHPKLKPLHPRRDASDLRLARGAVESGKPLLGICGGLQAVNVALGGSLHQHIPEMPELSGPKEHTAQDNFDSYHRIRLEPDCRLAAIMGSTDLEVNSAHHQSVDRVGEGLRAVARSEKGVVEALEGTADPDRFFVLVQWHPERLAVSQAESGKGDRPGSGRPDQLAIFEALVRAAR